MYIIPEPQEMSFKEGYYTITFDQKIVIDSSCSTRAYTYAKMLQQELRACAGYGLAITRGASGKMAVTLAMDAAMGEEKYRLKVREDGIWLTGGSDRGLLYGIQTLRQIIRQKGACVPYLDIYDYPAIKNRGFYYDVTRGRVPTLSYLKELADNLAFYKINQLQLYIEHTFLFENLSEVWRDDTPLNAQDIMEFDAYCRELNIELIPNISCFGHLYKLLRTRSYERLCEMPDSREEPFGFESRMAHHTINVTDGESLVLVKRLIDEFMPLFTSQYFNIGADETFDLGKGRSLEEAKRVGTKGLYVGYVKELCEYIVSKGKRPMLWGDVICNFLEVIKELPEQTICLNWGYDREQSDESTRKLAKAGAVQYSCPSVNGWNRLMPPLDVAYENIKRMCTYAFQYHTEGVLTTDWGDYGHINHPDFGIAGRIYGAAFSWNNHIPDFEEINRRISRVEFGDRSEKLVGMMAELSHNCTFQWEKAVRYIEHVAPAPKAEELKTTEEDLRNINCIADEIRQIMPGLPDRTIVILHACLMAVRGMELFQKIGVLVSAWDYHEEPVMAVDHISLAAELEEWFMFYKEVWRSVSRESELYRVQEVVFKYADLLREGNEIL